MLEPTISWNEMIHPDMNAIAKRDAFLLDENGKKLQEAIDQIHLMEEILDKNRWRRIEKNEAHCKKKDPCENG